MSKLIRNRWLCWAFFAASLIALGVGIYQIQPPEPMCVIAAAPFESPYLIAGGRRLIIFPGRMVEMEWPEHPPGAGGKTNTWVKMGPLKIRDTRTGEEIARHFEGYRNLSELALSKDGRYIAAEVLVVQDGILKLNQESSSIVLVDLTTGRLRDLPARGRAWGDSLLFSPNGKLLVSAGDDKWVRVYETETGRLLGERPSRKFVAVADDVITYFAATNTRGQNVIVWNPRENTVAAKLENTDGSSVLTSDGYYLVTKRHVEGEKHARNWIVWNLRTHRVDGEFQSGGMFPEGEYAAQPLVLPCKGMESEQLEIRELPTGRLLEKVAAKHFWTCAEGRFMAVTNANELVMREVPSMNSLWTRNLDAFKPLQFSPDSQTFFMLQLAPRELHGYDCRTGELRVKIALQHRDPAKSSLLLLARGRWLIAQDYSLQPNQQSPLWASIGKWIPMANQFGRQDGQTLVIVDYERHREHYRLDGSGSASTLVSDDGGTLVTLYIKGNERETYCVLRCWDVEAWKPLRWAGGVPAVLGVLIVLSLLWRRRRTVAAKHGFQKSATDETPIKHG